MNGQAPQRFYRLGKIPAPSRQFPPASWIQLVRSRRLGRSLVVLSSRKPETITVHSTSPHELDPTSAHDGALNPSTVRGCQDDLRASHSRPEILCPPHYRFRLLPAESWPRRFGWQSWTSIPPKPVTDGQVSVGNTTTQNGNSGSDGVPESTGWWDVEAPEPEIESSGLPLDVWGSLMPHNTGRACTILDRLIFHQSHAVTEIAIEECYVNPM